ncbi:hypothetical protein F5X68DRAFT_244099 [Plectosphaerella plurivora]|uniref:Uncharacterized protein n=1 Tax=Plectosphaerella plurivora TaxID=936078 RepID=A0A9P8VMT5_9PEZI|nr:hypothetical protein F5X68DRAFT_244099 [Plectosphaerella plurivora]
MSHLLALPTPIRFSEWYSGYGYAFNSTSAEACSTSLATYLADYRNLQTDTCDAHLDCILENTSESLKAKMSSAAIFLGVLPAMLSMLGPSISQLSLLSIRRPFLSVLIAMSAGGFSVDRLFTVDSPAHILAGVQGERLVPRIRSTHWGILVSLTEYLLALASLFNILHLTTRLGDRTIMSFKCTIYFLPLLWAFSLTFVYLVVAVPFQFSVVARHLRGNIAASDSRSIDSSPHGANDDFQLMPLRNPGSTAYNPGVDAMGTEGTTPQKTTGTRSLIMRELTTSVSRRPTLRADDMPEFETWMAALLNIATFTLAVHILLGTCWFSSILFLSPGDAINIMLRFFGSAMACRLIVAVELAGMKAHEMSSPGKEQRAPATEPLRYETRISPGSQPYSGT